jgi:hypothetical protein
VTQSLLFSGWCVVLLKRPENVSEVQVTESFEDGGYLPRTYAESVRTVKLTTPKHELELGRDMLTGEEWRLTDKRLVKGF